MTGQNDAIDRQVLLDLTGGDAAFARELLEMFRNTLSERVRNIGAGIERGDLTRIKNASHQLKGAAAMVGAAVMTDICERIELAAKEGDVPPLTRLYEALTEAAEQVMKQLAQI